jgi:hypothetical protein
MARTTAKHGHKAAKGPAPARSRDELRHEIDLAKLRYRRNLTIVDQVFKLLRQVVAGAIIVMCAYFVFRSVDAIAGKKTELNSFIKGVLDMKIDRWVYLSLAGICGFGWRTERKLRRQTITEQSRHIKLLEARLAPERTSSGLLPDGTAKEEDRDDA